MDKLKKILSIIKEYVLFRRVIKFRIGLLSKHKTPMFQMWVEYKVNGVVTRSDLIYKTSK